MRFNKGFTLIEILIVISLIAVITTAAAGLFNYSLRLNQKAKAILEVKQVGDQVISLMASKIRQAQSIEIPNCSLPNPVPVNEITFINASGVSETISLVNGRIMYLSNYLTGDDLNTPNLNFTCYGTVAPIVVDISFDLAKNLDDPISGITLPFFTSVQLRQY